MSGARGAWRALARRTPPNWDGALDSTVGMSFITRPILGVAALLAPVALSSAAFLPTRRAQRTNCVKLNKPAVYLPSGRPAERSAEMRLLQMLLASVALSSAAFLPGSLPRRSAVSSHTPRVAAVAMNGDYYSRLGVQRNADEKDIKNVSTQPARSSWHARAAFSLLPAISPARPLASRTLLTRRPLGCRRTESRRDSGTRMSTRRRRRRRNSRRLTRPTR